MGIWAPGFQPLGNWDSIHRNPAPRSTGNGEVTNLTAELSEHPGFCHHKPSNPFWSNLHLYLDCNLQEGRSHGCLVPRCVPRALVPPSTPRMDAVNICGRCEQTLNVSQCMWAQLGKFLISLNSGVLFLRTTAKVSPYQCPSISVFKRVWSLRWKK